MNENLCTSCFFFALTILRREKRGGGCLHLRQVIWECHSHHSRLRSPVAYFAGHPLMRDNEGR
jgi:hypothetical protein